jgi:hypothetical protein
MDKKIRYYLNGEIKERKEFDLILKDIEHLENLPNNYEERVIILKPYDMNKGRKGMRYVILDGTNLIHIPGKESSKDPKGLRHFKIKEGKLVEIISE